MSKNTVYNEKGDAKHYDQDRINTIIKMERIWGTEAIMYHCEITAFKYRERLGKKLDHPIELDLLKAEWYEKAAAYYYDKLHNGNPIIILSGGSKEPLPWNKNEQSKFPFDE